jgi:2,3-bisphosphoglycerate-dependent phosphoglycerate mutase
LARAAAPPTVGHADVDLDEDGHLEAECAGKALCDIHIHHAHVSNLKRTHQTLDGIKRGLGLKEDTLIPVKHHALNERHYGIHTGKNKWEVKELVGEEEFHRIRRNWDHPIPEGETLKDVHDRVVPYYEESIKPDLIANRNVLVVAHGNTLRALVKHLENIAEDMIADLEIGTGEVYCYEIDIEGAIIGKEIRTGKIETVSV